MIGDYIKCQECSSFSLYWIVFFFLFNKQKWYKSYFRSTLSLCIVLFLSGGTLDFLFSPLAKPLVLQPPRDPKDHLYQNLLDVICSSRGDDKWSIPSVIHFSSCAFQIVTPPITQWKSITVAIQCCWFVFEGLAALRRTRIIYEPPNMLNLLI